MPPMLFIEYKFALNMVADYKQYRVDNDFDDSFRKMGKYKQPGDKAG